MKYTIPGLLIFTLFACKGTSEVKFTAPQPETEKALLNFNRSILGTYANTCDTLDLLVIENNLIRTRKVENNSFSRSDIDSNGIAYIKTLVGNPRITGDSIFFTQVIEDTIFKVDKDQVLKKLHRNYFLNYKQDDSYWRVKMIQFNRDTLIIGEISPSDSLMRFDFVAREDSSDFNSRPVDENYKTKKDSSDIHNYILDPDKRDLKKMIRAGLFERTEIYIKKNGH